MSKISNVSLLLLGITTLGFSGCGKRSQSSSTERSAGVAVSSPSKPGTDANTASAAEPVSEDNSKLGLYLATKIKARIEKKYSPAFGKIVSNQYELALTEVSAKKAPPSKKTLLALVTDVNEWTPASFTVKVLFQFKKRMHDFAIANPEMIKTEKYTEEDMNQTVFEVIDTSSTAPELQIDQAEVIDAMKEIAGSPTDQVATDADTLQHMGKLVVRISARLEGPDAKAGAAQTEKIVGAFVAGIKNPTALASIQKGLSLGAAELKAVGREVKTLERFFHGTPPDVAQINAQVIVRAEKEKEIQKDQTQEPDNRKRSLKPNTNVSLPDLSIANGMRSLGGAIYADSTSISPAAFQLFRAVQRNIAVKRAGNSCPSCTQFSFREPLKLISSCVGSVPLLNESAGDLKIIFEKATDACHGALKDFNEVYQSLSKSLEKKGLSDVNTDSIDRLALEWLRTKYDGILPKPEVAPGRELVAMQQMSRTQKYFTKRFAEVPCDRECALGRHAIGVLAPMMQFSAEIGCTFVEPFEQKLFIEERSSYVPGEPIPQIGPESGFVKEEARLMPQPAELALVSAEREMPLMMEYSEAQPPTKACASFTSLLAGIRERFYGGAPNESGMVVEYKNLEPIDGEEKDQQLVVREDLSTGLTDIKIQTTTTAFRVGTTVQLVAIGYYEDGTSSQLNALVDWSIGKTDPSVAKLVVEGDIVTLLALKEGDILVSANFAGFSTYLKAHVVSKLELSEYQVESLEKVLMPAEEK